jgi:hypothetical protein
MSDCLLSAVKRVKLLWSLLVLLLALAPLLQAAEQQGEMIYQTDFEAENALQSWSDVKGQRVQLVPGRGGSQAVEIERPAKDGAGYATIRTALPVEKLRGKRVAVEALAKAQDVAKPPQPWNGVKCMLNTVAPGGQQWSQQNAVFGTFDWKPLRFVAEVPADATEAWLVLGLEATTGKAWFDDIKVSIVGSRRRAPTAKPGATVYKGHDLPRLRGAMISPNVKAEDLRVLGGQWKANHVRWQLLWGGFPHSPADKGDLAAYDAWLESALKHLDGLLPVCEELGIKVLIDLHTPPGGRNAASECQMFHEQRFQEAFLKVWDKIARRYRGNKTVWGYDLVNEPVEGVVSAELMDWHALAAKTAKAVRAIDPDHAIVIEPAPWGSPASLDWFDPLDVPGVVYSVHMYIPHQFTHQGVYENPKGLEYPGKIAGKFYDKEQLRKALQPAIDYQRDYGVHIYIGEFSAIRWAPGKSAYNYLRDVIDICEENNWDWAYHAFREWDGWSVEHGPDPKDHARSKTPTDREQLLRSWYGKNEKGK